VHDIKIGYVDLIMVAVNNKRHLMSVSLPSSARQRLTSCSRDSNFMVLPTKTIIFLACSSALLLSTQSGI
jgi:hypothetical protein